MRKRIALLCATRRGYLFLEKLVRLLPQADFVVFSFKEEPWEPPFLDSIRELTQQHGGEFHEARQVGTEKWGQFWEANTIDVMFAISWRYMIPPAVYNRARAGAFVIHDSLLPSYRGFSPTVWSIINGQEWTGATLFAMAEGVDEGDIVDQQPVPIGPDETIAEVMKSVTVAYLELLERNIENLVNGTASRSRQDHSKATYCCRRLPADNAIQWSLSSSQIFNFIRALTTPYPGAFTTIGGKRLVIWEARRLNRKRLYVGSVPGRIVEFGPEGATVLTGDGELLLTLVQFEEEEKLPAGAVLRSLNITLGT